MSFKGLTFIRQWAKDHIYKPRILGTPPSTAPVLAASLRQEADSAEVELKEIEDEVGDVEKKIGKLLEGRRLDRN